MRIQYTARKNRGYVQVTRWLQSDPLTHCFLTKQQPTLSFKNRTSMLVGAVLYPKASTSQLPSANCHWLRALSTKLVIISEQICK